jgi:hypothetical protein
MLHRFLAEHQYSLAARLQVCNGGSGEMKEGEEKADGLEGEEGGGSEAASLSLSDSENSEE